ncbi:hypothetical protein FocTR4_00016900, partial [Fusarium oxysporum f. sp. cubense]
TGPDTIKQRRVQPGDRNGASPTPRTGTSHDIPEWRRDKYILGGYRPLEADYLQVIKSIRNHPKERKAKVIFKVFNPPICPVNGSAYPGIERTSDYIIRVIDSLQKDRLRSVCIKKSAQDAFNRWVQSHIAEMLWSEPCSSWFQQKVIVPWPGTILHYYAATEIVRWENYDLKFEQDDQKFASFGNGITEEGFTPKSIPRL